MFLGSKIGLEIGGSGRLFWGHFWDKNGVKSLDFERRRELVIFWKLLSFGAIFGKMWKIGSWENYGIFAFIRKKVDYTIIMIYSKIMVYFGYWCMKGKILQKSGSKKNFCKKRIYHNFWPIFADFGWFLEFQRKLWYIGKKNVWKSELSILPNFFRKSSKKG